ncbi:MAG TPA: DNA methyltransferase [Candidatus Angelobacter sp.]|jgi:DNA modification methylase
MMRSFDWRKYCKPEYWHDDASLLPLMDNAALEIFAMEIEKHGVQQPIVLFEGKVLDGRNRLRACAKQNLDLTQKDFVQFNSTKVSASEFVFINNLHRQHLTIDQRTAVAAELVPRFAKDAKARQTSAGKNGIRGGRGNKKPLAQNCAKGIKASAEAALFVGGVSARYVEVVISLEKKKHGTLKRIKEGKITIQQAQREIDVLHTNGKTLSERFIAPMISLLDAKSGEWQKKKQLWRALGVKDGHNEQVNSNQPRLKKFSDTSVFDPVLAECVYRWFARDDGGSVLDPFAGEATKGIVAGFAGLKYTGCERRRKQVKANERQANAVAKKYLATTGKDNFIPPRWIECDSAQLDEAVPQGEKYDLIFTSPPYYNKEKYSSSKEDGSNFETYSAFLKWYENIFRLAVARLKPNRFLVVKVENLKDAKGFYINFVGDNIRMFEGLGLRLHSDAIFATPIGSAAQRTATRFPTSRQLESVHQNILCFWNGDNPRLIRDELGELKAD